MIRLSNPFLESLQDLQKLFHGAKALFKFRERRCMTWDDDTLRLPLPSRIGPEIHIKNCVTQCASEIN